MHDWFNSYLCYRFQFVDIKGHKSSLAGPSLGESQGSVLGPLLFLLYINDLPLISKICKFILFADDTPLLLHEKLYNSLTCLINSILVLLNSWFVTDKLSLNLIKTCVVPFNLKTLLIFLIFLDPDNTKSYRPISNLSFVPKLIERLVSHRLTSYLSQRNLLPTLQSAYRQNYSTEAATLKVISDALDTADADQITLLAMLDLSAAFDTLIMLLCWRDCSVHMASVARYLNGLSRSSQTGYKLLRSPASNRHRWRYCMECLKVLYLDRCSSTFTLLMSSALPSHLTSAFIATLMTFSCMSVALLLTHLLLWLVYLRASR